MNKFLFLVGAYLKSPVHALLCIRPDLSLKVSLVSVNFFFYYGNETLTYCLTHDLVGLGIAILFIHRINHYPLDSAIGFPLILANAYLLGTDLSGG